MFSKFTVMLANVDSTLLCWGHAQQNLTLEIPVFLAEKVLVHHALSQLCVIFWRILPPTGEKTMITQHYQYKLLTLTILIILVYPKYIQWKKTLLSIACLWEEKFRQMFSFLLKQTSPSIKSQRKVRHHWREWTRTCKLKSAHRPDSNGGNGSSSRCSTAQMKILRVYGEKSLWNPHWPNYVTPSEQLEYLRVIVSVPSNSEGWHMA